MHSPDSNKAVQLLQNAIERELYLKRVFSMLLCLLGLVFILLFASKTWLLSGLGVCAFVAGGVLTFGLMRQSSHNNPLMNLLNDQAEDIVWVYVIVTQRMPFGLRFTENAVFYFKKIDRTDLTLGVPHMHIPVISRYLNQKLPHATFGYTRDREQWYMAAPEILIRHEDD